MKTQDRASWPGLPILALAVVVLSLTGCRQLVKKLPPLPRLPAPETTGPTQTAPSPQSPTIAQMEGLIRDRINTIRQKQGLEPLEPNPQLAQVARDYSQQMARQNFFSHTSPSGETPADRVRAVGLTYWMVGENLFQATNIPDLVPAAVEGWMNSPGHRQNLLQSGYTETGVGIWREDNTYYVTQLFMRAL